MPPKLYRSLAQENEQLRLELKEARQALEELRSGLEDAAGAERPAAPQVFASEGASPSFRVLIEAMREDAAALGRGGARLDHDGRLLRSESAKVLEKRLLSPEGHRSSLVTRTSRREGESGIAGLVGRSRELTERERLEMALRRSEARFGLLARTASRLLAAEDPQSLVDELCREVMERLDCQAFFHSLIDQATDQLRLSAWAGVADEEARQIQSMDLSATICGCVARSRVRIIAEDISHSTDPRTRQIGAWGIRTYCCHPLIGQGRLLGTLAFGTRTRDRFTTDEIELMNTVADQVAISMERMESKRALTEANAQLLEADRRKNEFLAVLSHELRNPLAPIKSSIFILNRAEPGGDQARRAQAVIERQVDLLAHLVDDLLDVTRITRNKIQLQKQPLELNELVHRTMEDHRALFEKSEVCLELAPAPEPIFVSGDWSRLAQVLGNLLQNAAKFTVRGGITRVIVSRDLQAMRAVIRVADTGAGMAPAMLSRLFQPFMQADTTLDRGKGGLGLGLALVKGIVELHGGEIAAHSAGLGKGAEFVVRLPLAQATAAHGRGAPQAARPSRRRVLIIEDNVDAADSLRDVLEFGEHEVAVAHDGREGLTKARELRPEVVLCDIGLPG
ncbi:MAG: hybrid sensor histidine kinase/response regulator, partial [Deltaproteobacteria bacterium]|nr:hybrid sensor histidine kinase/response regulator [Deltaproteobacteria bacterium]